MALGTDNRLKSNISSPLSKRPMAPMVKQGAVDDVNNNVLAGVSGAGRMASQQMGGRGISSGRGQQSRADMAQAMADAKAQQQVQQNNMAASAENQARSLAYDTAMRGEQIQNQGLLDSLTNVRRSEQMSGLNRGNDLSEARQRGMLGLNQIYLDRTPLFQSLLQGLF